MAVQLDERLRAEPAQLALADRKLSNLAAHGRELTGQLPGVRLEHGGKAGEPDRVRHGLDPGCCEAIIEPHTPLMSSLGNLSVRRGRAFEGGDAVAAYPGTFGHQPFTDHGRGSSVPLGLRGFARPGVALSAGGHDLRVKQPRSQLGEEKPHRVSLALGVGAAGQCVVIPLTGRDQRCQGCELVAGPADRLVCLGEVLEVGDDSLHPCRGVDRLEHVLADELVEISHRLHRDGLVEQLHRLLRTDPQQPSGLPRVVGEHVVELSARGAKPALEVLQVVAEVSEVGLDRQHLGGRDEEPVRLTGLVLLVEHLCE